MAKIGGGGQQDPGNTQPEPSKGVAEPINQPTVRDPFASISRPLRDDGDAPGASWFTATREVAQALALDWFSQYETATLRDYLESRASDDQLAGLTLKWTSDGKLGHDLDAIRIIPDVLEGPDGLGELVAFDESALGQKVRAYMSLNGTLGSETTVVPLGGMLSDTGKLMSWYGPWETEFGSRAFIRFEIRRDSSGTEWCFVHTNVAVATRKPLGYARMVSENIKVPWLMPSQLFVAETPFPSTIASMSRSSAYPDIPEELWPRPLVSVDSPGLVTFVSGTDSHRGTIKETVASFPSVIRAGFAFSDKAADYLDTLVSSLATATTNLATIAEDGFRNYRNPNYPASFDHTYGSEYVLFVDGPEAEGRQTEGYSRWVPETLLGDLVRSTNEVAEAVRRTSDLDAFRSLSLWIVDEGAGDSVASTINLMFDKILFPQQWWDDAMHWLDIAVDLDDINEGTRALVNLGRIFIEKEELTFAKERLVEALGRRDGFCESEAIFLLGTIALKESEPEVAKEYFERGARAVGEAQAEFAEKCRAQLEPAVDTPQKRAFCSQCGVALSPGVRFCSSCGSSTEQ